jgi:hypothetical protein
MKGSYYVARSALSDGPLAADRGPLSAGRPTCTPRGRKVSAMSDHAALSGSERYRAFLRDQSREIRASARQAGFFDHRPTTGAAREWVLRKPLEEVLPYRYAVAGGQVLAANDAISTQWDVLIYSRLDTPRLYSTPAATILPIEGVLAAISVKSKVDEVALEDAAKAATQLSRDAPCPDTSARSPGLAEAARIRLWVHRSHPPDSHKTRQGSRPA